MTIPINLLLVFALIGFVNFAFYLKALFTFLYYKFKKLDQPLSLEELNISILKEENQRLSSKISLLEKENNQITSLIIQRIS
jgi:hypothetical protein